MAKQWVIGDIHGCAKTLRLLLEEQIKPTAEDELFFLGDYIDRGPNSKGVIEHLMTLRLMGYNMKALMGNHERMLLDTLNNKSAKKAWFYNGGMNTLQSFGVNDSKEVPEQYIGFLESLEYFIELDDFLLVHAGLNFELDNPMEDKEGMMWIRNEQVFPEKIGMKKMIHGHTPIALEKIESSINDPENYAIDLDNGCVYYGTEGLGNLCALELNSMQLAVQPNVDVWG